MVAFSPTGFGPIPPKSDPAGVRRTRRAGCGASAEEGGHWRFLGVSGTFPFSNLVEQIEMGVFDAFRIPYSAPQREHEDRFVISLFS